MIFPRSCCKSSIASDMKRKLHFLFSLFVLSSPLLHHWWHSVWKQKQDTRQRRKKQLGDFRKYHETKLSKQRSAFIFLINLFWKLPLWIIFCKLFVCTTFFLQITFRITFDNFHFGSLFCKFCKSGNVYLFFLNFANHCSTRLKCKLQKSDKG